MTPNGSTDDDGVAPAGRGPADEAQPLRLQPLTRAKVGSLGVDGQAWLDRLPVVLAELAQQWRVEIGRPLPGGSASYVVGAVGADGRPAVIKVVIDDAGLELQTRTLRQARGRGYARLYAFDAERRALLLEALGQPLDHSRRSAEQRLDLLADTLTLAWQRPDAAAEPQDKAAGLATLIRTWWPAQGRPCSEAVYRQALTFAERRSADPGEAVVVHGDPHPGNLLQLRSPRPGADTGYAFVDPDGFVADRAYDLGVVLRDWTSQLRGVDAPAVLRRYCARLADRTGVAEQPIWEWGFVERVSTGLYLKSFGADGLAARFLSSAEALV
ncbi:MAG TPA: aminoglycoside phosphotransferase family protein [Microlunatus sp.]|nr:aminoglycoside phosphotransferase family protein [Microlunatus sp.]